MLDVCGLIIYLWDIFGKFILKLKKKNIQNMQKLTHKNIKIYLLSYNKYKN